MKFPALGPQAQLAYCTNIHPAESWQETREMLVSHVLPVRDRLRTLGRLGADETFAIGLRLSARAARELLHGDALVRFREWLALENCNVFTINGFPYGSFHGTRVKEQVFHPDWSTDERLDYTVNLFRILVAIAPPGSQASVSTLPGSHKSFHCNEDAILANLRRLAVTLDHLSEQSGIDLHLGLEPEPLGHFENCRETLAFFERLHGGGASDVAMLTRRIGLNYDSCHFALQFDQAKSTLKAFRNAGIRLSKVHLSSAVDFDPGDAAAVEAIRKFDEPTYFHQTLLRGRNYDITRFGDLPEFLNAYDRRKIDPGEYLAARTHFHIPLGSSPAPPLRSTMFQVSETLEWLIEHPGVCAHFEIETYTWAVLPKELRRPVTEQLAAEYEWVIDHVAGKTTA